MNQGQTPLRIGLIGCGKMGLHHIAAIGRAPGATLVGIADPLVDAEELKGLVPADAVVSADLDVMLAKARPDVVHVVTPPGTHVPIARKLIEAGVHLYVEKPFAMTTDEARTILDLANQRGVKVCAGHQNLFERPAILARERIASIGRLVHVESFFSFRMVRRTITPAEQAKDILPHAVYPLVDQMRAGTGLSDSPITISGLDVRATGDVYALLRLGDCTGVLLVTLSGRPIEQYQNIVGSNGVLRADYVTGSLSCILGPGAGPGVLLTPYRRSFQTIVGMTRGIAGLLFGHHGSYPGLTVLTTSFYDHVRGSGPAPMTPQSILDTVGICEQIGAALDAAEREQEEAAAERLEAPVQGLPPTSGRPVVLVTGGTGLLGRRTVEELRQAGHPVRVVARRMPRASLKIPGVEYVTADLASGLAEPLFAGVDTIVHCAAETSGGMSEQRRNSIAATRLLIERGAAAGVRRFLHVSSLAVLKPGNGKVVDEATAVDSGNIGRGPYVWGKAESEVIAQRLGAELGMSVKVLRPGPLVDYAAYQAPGRLGRELGPWYVAIGPKSSPLSVLDVGTGARVIRSYVEQFAAAPPLVNLVESPAPARVDLVRRLRDLRPDLRVVWMPSLLLKILSGPAKLVQKWLMGADKPVDLFAAFSSERYNPDIAAAVIRNAGASRVMDATPGAAQ